MTSGYISAFCVVDVVYKGNKPAEVIPESNRSRAWTLWKPFVV